MASCSIISSASAARAGCATAATSTGRSTSTAPAYDDLLTRGNGELKLPANFNSYFEYQRPRMGSWGYEVELEAFSGGLAGNDMVGYRIKIEPRYFISDALNLYVGVWNWSARRTGWCGSRTLCSAASTSTQTERECRLQLDHRRTGTSCG